MTKKKDLASALQAQDENASKQAETVVVSEKPRQANAGPKKTVKVGKTREGMVNIAGWFPTNVKFELEELRLQRSRKAGRKITLQEIQAEAYNDLFKKYGRPELAPISSK